MNPYQYGGMGVPPPMGGLPDIGSLSLGPPSGPPPMGVPPPDFGGGGMGYGVPPPVYPPMDPYAGAGPSVPYPPQGYGAPSYPDYSQQQQAPYPPQYGGAPAYPTGGYGEQAPYPPQYGTAPAPYPYGGGGDTRGNYAYQAQLASPCTGRKKSLLIGISYKNTNRPLPGCLNDVRNIRKFITERYNFPADPGSMVVLTDDSTDASRRPTKANIIHYMRWLVADANPGDSLFLHFSGHGGQVRDTNGDEDDGFDETILPEDYASKGQIVDDDMHDILVKPLKPGVRLTVIFDSCHSGTALDLQFIYNERGLMEGPDGVNTAIAGSGYKTKKKNKKMKKMKQGKAGKVGKAGKKGKEKKGKGGGATPQQAYQSLNSQQRKKVAYADCIMFAGCRDDQTSVDTSIQGFGRTGAMSYAFISALTRNRNLSYTALLASMRDILRAHNFQQVAQMSTGMPMDMNQAFVM